MVMGRGTFEVLVHGEILVFQKRRFRVAVSWRFAISPCSGYLARLGRPSIAMV